MNLYVFVGVAGLILGGIVGGLIQQRVIRQHQHPLAVMWLAQYHVESLQSAVQKGDCAVAAQSTASLQALANELALALPQATAQDAHFRGYIDQLKSAAGPGAVPAGQCAYDATLLKRIRDTCADCHRDYR